MGFTKFIYRILYIQMFEILLCALSYVMEKNKNLLILDTDDQNTTYVFAFKGTHALYLSLKLQEEVFDVF